jgi:hypothetical protein
LFETFGRGGYFSLRPMPITEAEQQQAEPMPAPQDITRLNLDVEQPKRV